MHVLLLKTANISIAETWGAAYTRAHCTWLLAFDMLVSVRFYDECIYELLVYEVL